MLWPQKAGRASASEWERNPRMVRAQKRRILCFFSIAIKLFYFPSAKLPSFTDRGNRQKWGFYQLFLANTKKSRNFVVYY